LTESPFEVFAFTRLPPSRLPDAAIPSWAWLSVQRRLRSAGITSMWFGDPAMPLAFRPGYAVFPCRPPLANNVNRYADKPLVRFRRPPGLSRMTASRCLSTSTPSMGFVPSWHMRSQKVRFPRDVPDPPPSVLRVSCHPLDGLLPFAPCRPCFRPTAPSGFSLRSVLLAEVQSTFLPMLTPLVVTHRPSFDEPFGLSEVRAC